MNLEDKKNAYAKLIISAGVHLRPGQKVYVTCPVEQYEFARLVVKEAYAAGAEEVILHYADGLASRMKYENAPLSVFENLPEWIALERNTLAKSDTCFIHMIGEDPEIFKGIDPAKLKANLKECHEKMNVYYKLQSSMGFKWNIVAVPTEVWASKVFPELSPEDAVCKLWEAIFATVRINESSKSPYEQWMEHADTLKEKTRQLNRWQLKELVYENELGTSFTVGLVKNHHWEGGADTDPVDQGRFFANMPTEEVFTMPDRRKAEGRLVASKPLSYQGTLIEDFYFDFKEGKVVGFDAKKGKEALELLLSSDEGSKHLGEVALVPYPSPVEQQGILFLETLFDENAACHFALGACYETNLEGGVSMSEEELEAHGGNTSMNHVDFMVGTKDLKITGITWENEKVPVFEKGTWAF